MYAGGPVDERQEHRFMGRNGRIEIVDGLEDTDEDARGIGRAVTAPYFAPSRKSSSVGVDLLRLRARFCDQPLHGIATEDLGC
jgi:hypothetical protein